MRRSLVLCLPLTVWQPDNAGHTATRAPPPPVSCTLDAPVKAPRVANRNLATLQTAASTVEARDLIVGRCVWVGI